MLPSLSITPEAVTVAVDADAHVGSLLLYLGYEVNHVLLFEWVWQVMGEIAVRLDVDAADVAAKGFVDFQRGGAGYAVAGVNDHFQGALYFHRVDYVFDVVGLRGVIGVFAFALVELAALYDAA